MLLIVEVLWAILLLLFFAGCLAYPFNRHLGLALLKRAAILLGVILIGPSLVMAALGAIPPGVLVLLLGGASIAAYFYLTSHATKGKQHDGQRASHAERQPRVPHQGQHDK